MAEVMDGRRIGSAGGGWGGAWCLSSRSKGLKERLVVSREACLIMCLVLQLLLWTGRSQGDGNEAWESMSWTDLGARCLSCYGLSVQDLEAL